VAILIGKKLNKLWVQLEKQKLPIKQPKSPILMLCMILSDKIKLGRVKLSYTSVMILWIVILRLDRVKEPILDLSFCWTYILQRFSKLESFPQFPMITWWA
jgi:hypothetical protein